MEKILKWRKRQLGAILSETANAHNICTGTSTGDASRNERKIDNYLLLREGFRVEELLDVTWSDHGKRGTAGSWPSWKPSSNYVTAVKMRRESKVMFDKLSPKHPHSRRRRSRRVTVCLKGVSFPSVGVDGYHSIHRRMQRGQASILTRSASFLELHECSQN